MEGSSIAVMEICCNASLHLGEVVNVPYTAHASGVLPEEHSHVISATSSSCQRNQHSAGVAPGDACTAHRILLWQP